jgi:PBSX family phage terminase large subunit
VSTLLAPPSVQHHYEPRGAAVHLFNSRRSEILLSGPAGTGKSRACLEKANSLALANDGCRGLMVRKTATSLTSTGLVTWREKVVPEGLKHGVLSFFGGSAQEAAGYRYSNGSFIAVGGMDKPSKIMSSEYDFVYVQEATELTTDDWEAITTRLRNGVISFQQVIADCNPAQPTHWLKLRCDRGDALMLHSRHEDNPVYFGEDGKLTPKGIAYIEKLDKLTGVRKGRLRFGRWEAAEGLVYEDFDPRIHVLDRFAIPAEWTTWVSVDFGFNHPAVAQIWREDGDGRLYLAREVFKTGTLVEDLGRELKALLAQMKIRPRAVICDHDAEGRATLEKYLGLSTSPAKKTVTDGIEKVQSRLRVQEDGKPRLYVLRDAVVKRDDVLEEAARPASTEEEFPGYVWAIKPGGELKEEPVKEMDDGMDALRYMVAELDLGGRPGVRVLR